MGPALFGAYQLQVGGMRRGAREMRAHNIKVGMQCALIEKWVPQTVMDTTYFLS